MSGNQPYEFGNIPDELTSIVQWLVWKYELKEGGLDPLLPTSWTKVPYQVRNARMKCDPTNPSHLAPFSEAVALYERRELEFSGIGFAILGTENPRITCIDLDTTEDETIRAFQTEIYNWFSNTYAEISPSGHGCHLWAYGEAPSGRRKGVEIYSQKRYITMTGWSCRDRKLPLANYDEDIKSFRESMNKEISGDRGKGYNEPQREDDATIYNRAITAHNGENFRALWNGNWEGKYPSQSEADIAIVNMIAFYTQNREQIARLFFASGLGQRDKLRSRDDLFQKMIDKAFDRLPPIVDYEAMTNSLNAVRAEYIARESAKGAEVSNVSDIKENDPYTRPPGLLGDIADFIYHAYPIPVKEFALSGAIGFMSGICGREYNISGTGLNLYILNIAHTGAGKEAINSGISKLISTVRMQVPDAPMFTGPGRFGSDAGLLKVIRDGSKSKSFLSVVGEFGSEMSKFSNTNNAALTGLKGLLLDLFNKSGKGNILNGTAYSSAVNNETNRGGNSIESPAFSMLGETTPQTMYQHITEDTIMDGLVPRFLLIEYSGFSEEFNKHSHMVDPSPELVQNLANLMNQVLSWQRQPNGRFVIDVGFSPDADRILEDYRLFNRRQMKQSIEAKENEALAELRNRSHMKALRLAALCAVGQNFTHPIINEFDAKWAINIVEYGTELLIGKFRKGEIGTQTAANMVTRQMKDVKEAIRYFHSTEPKALKRAYKSIKDDHINDKIFPIYAIRQRVIGKKSFAHLTDEARIERAFRSVIDQLISSDAIQLENKINPNANRKRRSECFVITDPHQIFDQEN